MNGGSAFEGRMVIFYPPYDRKVAEACGGSADWLDSDVNKVPYLMIDPYCEVERVGFNN